MLVINEFFIGESVAVLGGDLANHSDPTWTHGIDAVYHVAYGALGEQVVAQGAALGGQAGDGPVVFLQPTADQLTIQSWHAGHRPQMADACAEAVPVLFEEVVVVWA